LTLPPWPFTADQTLAIFGPATVAAIIAAIFAPLAYFSGRKEAERAAQRRDLDIQPRVNANFPVAGLQLSLTNVGGPAVHFIWVGTHDDTVRAACGGMGSSAAALYMGTFELGQQSDYTAGSTATLLLIAEDVDGRWWDCRSRILLRDKPETYLTKRLEQCLIGHLSTLLWANCGPKLLPPEATHL
jgi:hypothetical protein